MLNSKVEAEEEAGVAEAGVVEVMCRRRPG
jgi:hypothetical protein